MRRALGIVILALIAAALILGLWAAERTRVATNTRDERVYGVGGQTMRMSGYLSGQWLTGTSGEWALNPDAPLPSGYSLHLVSAEYPYYDQDGKQCRARAMMAYSERRRIGALAESEASNKLVEALRGAASSGSFDASKAIDAIPVSFPDNQLEGWVMAEGDAQPHAQRRRGFAYTPPADSHRMADLAREQAVREGEALGLRVVRHASALEAGQMNDPAARDELLRQYAGEQVLVDYANGSLWAVYDDAPLGEVWARLDDEDGCAQLDIRCRILALTGSAPGEILSLAGAALERLYVDEKVSFAELRPKLLDALGLELGISDRDALANSVALSHPDD